MEIFHSFDLLPADYGPTVASVGNFDGVHLAHRHVLAKVVERARAQRLKAVAVTFDPHPIRVLRPHIAPKLITPLPLKLKLLESTGLDATVVVPFTRDLSLTHPRDFAREYLKDKLHVVEIHEGANFHFGHKAEGNVDRLQEFGKEFGFEVIVYPEMRIRGETVSSSAVRDLVRAGRVSRAKHLLGRPFSIVATPGRGRGYGHKYTVPTINLADYSELVPVDGVYITRTQINGELFDSVTNVGDRPTFGKEAFAIETHLLNFHPIELTAQTRVEICFLYWLRPEIKFPDVESLRAQIGRDVHRARRYLHLFHLLQTGSSGR